MSGRDERRVWQVWEQALGRPAGERAAYLDEACAGDADLRQEVEALLAERSSGAGFLDTAAWKPERQPLAAGTRVGPYEIQALIGAGGMGEVYKARDTRLGRTVAVKVLPPDFARDPARRRRFEQEARAISALNHPHICTLHDIGSANGTDYLVMEYLEGQTLGERLARGRLPLAEALEYAAQIAEALAKAHRQGIVHRDLKPGNVMITESGVKLLDFGLAKLRGPAAPSAGLSSRTTREPSATAEGTIIGTLAYMAPEQLEGKETDARTDLFALGAVLYEMLTGKRAFAGGSQASIISAIMSSQPPPVSAIQPVTPPAVDRLVQRCLAKEPDRRWQTASDVAAELDWLSKGSTPATPQAVAAPPFVRRRGWPWLAAAAVLFVLAVSIAWWMLPGHSAGSARPQARYRQVTFTGDVMHAALAPDGRTIAYIVADGHSLNVNGPIRLLVRDIDSTEALEVWRSPESFARPAWMPDGQQVLLLDYWSRAAWLVPRFGGTPQPLEGVTDPGFGVAVSRDGSRIAYGQGHAGKPAAYRIASLSPGTNFSRTLPDVDRISQLSWNRQGDRLAILGGIGEDDGLWVATPADGRAERVPQPKGNNVRAACWSPVADALYVLRHAGDTSELARLTFRASGRPDEEVLLTGSGRAGTSLQVSADGRRLLLLRPTGGANLWRLDLTHPGNAAPLTTGTWFLERPDVSPDGRWVLAEESEKASRLVTVPVPGGSPRPLIDRAGYGRWSPDGRRLAFVSSRSGRPRIWVADRDGAGARELQGAELSENTEPYWWPDGRLAWQTPDGRNYRIRDLDTGSEEPLLVEESRAGSLSGLRVSPKRDRVVVTRGGGGNDARGLWLVTWPGRRQRLLAAGWDISPIGWSPEGSFIYAVRFGQPEVLKVSAASGATETIGRFPGSLWSETCSMAPGGSAIVCSIADFRIDAWIVDDFDPHVEPPNK